LEIILAKSAGFCFGVSKAIELTEKLLEDKDRQIYTMGPIIHNEQVIEKLKEKGLMMAENISDIESGHIVIRTHGITPTQYEDIANNKRLTFSDATCPYVKKIHRLVAEMKAKGMQIIIIGDKNHPEVEGVNGWCGEDAYIVNDKDDVDKLPDSGKPVFVVAQTTITKEKWDELTKQISNRFANIEFRNTICNATGTRQKEAEEISSKVDMMLVIGSKKSSNTSKLFEICSKNCSNTYWIETVDDLSTVDIKNIKNIKKIGITAGASTPDWLIKEVTNKMEELTKQEKEVNFEEEFENSLVTLQSGQVVKGKIIGFNNTEVFVDLGYKSEGIISMDQFSDDPDFDPQKDIKIGEEIDVYINRVDDKEGNVYLSKKKVDRNRNWKKVESAFENKTPIEVKIVEVVKGGLIGKLEGIRIFIPASQVSDNFVNDLNKYLNETITVRIIEYNKKKKRLVGSQRVILEEEKEKKAKETWDNIEVGKEYEGVVKSITDFGVFVDIGGVDGLIHISELSWSKIKHPSEVVKLNDRIKVRVLEFDKEKGKISLGYRKLEDNPWYNAEEKYKVNTIVKGRVVRLVPFGAFINLEENIDGLVHISQISNVRIAKPSDVLKVGQEVEAKVIELDLEKKKIGLSIKEVNPIDPPAAEKKPVAPEKPKKENKKKEEHETGHKEELNITLGDFLNNAEIMNDASNASEDE